MVRLFFYLCTTTKYYIRNPDELDYEFMKIKQVSRAKKTCIGFCNSETEAMTNITSYVT